eukprot:g1863.t1
MVMFEPFRCANFTGCDYEDEDAMCEGDEPEPLVMLGVVVFASIFICVGSGCMSANLRRTKLEKQKRKFYRENGTQATGVVIGKEKRYVSGGENSSGHWVMTLIVELQILINGNPMRASKRFDYVQSEVFDACTERGPIPVVHIADQTNDARHFELQTVISSDSTGIMSNFVSVIFFGLFAGVGTLIAVSFLIGFLLPESIVITGLGLLIVLCSLVGAPFLCGRKVSSMYAKEKVIPKGTILPPTQPLGVAMMQPGMTQPTAMVQSRMVQQGMVQQGMVRQGMAQPGMVQQGFVQPGMVQQGMMQPGMVQQGFVQPGMVQPPGVAQQSNGQPGIVQPVMPQPMAIVRPVVVQPGWSQPAGVA